MSPFSHRFRPRRTLLTFFFCSFFPAASVAQTGLYLGSKAPYTPAQDSSTYEAAPAGFLPVFTELVARHGSRGLSSPSSDLVLYNMWLDAQARGGLTKAGARLGPDLLRIIQANALLGYNVPGISAPGYGNLTLLGIGEHTQLAQRLAARMGPMLSAVPGSSRQILISTSGVNRAIDSSTYFVGSLSSAIPGIATNISSTPALTAYPINKPVTQAPGINRFQLYFHKLAAKTDLPATTDPYYPVYQSSLQYQSFLASDTTMLSKVNGIVYGPSSYSSARTVLYTLFTQQFVNLLDAGTTSYVNTGSYTYTSSDGRFTTMITGDGATSIKNVVDAANALYAVYSITPAMVNEVPVNMGKYFPAGTLPTFNYLSDAQDFYQKGPSITEEAPITYQMSQALLDDFFNEADAIAAGNLAHAAKLRFTHAEILIPFEEKLGLTSASQSVPAAQNYTWDNNPWRGEINASLAANVQWDLFTDGSTLLVKMFYNEKETDFPAACEAARYLAGTQSHFYRYSGLKTCYGR